MTLYIIKYYTKMKLDNKFVFIANLPYIFPEEPFNICAQLNKMFPDSKHIIAIKED